MILFPINIQNESVEHPGLLIKTGYLQLH